LSASWYGSGPLISRPAYGESESEDSTVAEAKLPEGSPGGKGLSLDDSIPGTKTFVKPEGDPPRESPNEDESMFRVDDADDLTKDQSRTDIDNNESMKDRSFGYAPPGKDDSSKTKYPYRNDRKLHAYVVEASVVTHALVLPLVGETLKVAAKLDTIESGLNPAMVERGEQCTATLKRADNVNLRWIFAVDCGNGAKVVKIHAERNPRVVAIPKMDLHVTCSCPAWRWLGPEHHSKRDDYLEGDPRGTASVPVIRDPENINRVCKHVAAVLSTIRKWQIPSEKRRAVKQVMKKE
jgi:hypothetical protein